MRSCGACVPLKLSVMTIRRGIENALERIESARQACGRTDPVELQLAVKTRSAAQCQEAALSLCALGCPILLGHNRVQEARATADAIHEVEGAQIALIGPLQSNKINQALACVNAIDTLDSSTLVKKIDSRLDTPLPVLVEVNVSGEEHKHGCAPAEAMRVVDSVLDSHMLLFRGFMTVGLHSRSEKDVRSGYALLRALYDRAEKDTGIANLTLSMGMSGDMEWAIAEGATRVRVGTAVFGARA